MHPLRRVSAFLLLSLLAYAALIAPWPGVMEAYRTYFCAVGNTLFRSFGAATVTFKPIPAADHTMDTTIRINAHRGPSGEFDVKSLYSGYRPTAFLIALVIATPIAWRRRLCAMLWCLVGVNVFVFVRVALRLWDVMSNPLGIHVFDLSPGSRRLLAAAARVLYDSPAVDYTIPAFIWLIVCFRRDDLQRLLGGTPTVRRPDAPGQPAAKRTHRRR